MSLVSVTKISSVMLISVAEQASLSLTWSETPEDTFSHDEAHIYCIGIGDGFTVGLILKVLVIYLLKAEQRWLSLAIHLYKFAGDEKYGSATCTYSIYEISKTCMAFIKVLKNRKMNGQTLTTKKQYASPISSMFWV